MRGRVGEVNRNAIESVVAGLKEKNSSGVESDRMVAYAMGLGDPKSRRAYEQFGPSLRGAPVGWIPAPYTTCHRRACELLPEGPDLDDIALRLTPAQICRLALEKKAAGFHPRKVASSTTGTWYNEKKMGHLDGKARTAKARAALAQSANTRERKLTECQIDEIRTAVRNGLSLRKVALQHAVSHQTVHRIVKDDVI